MLDWRGMDVLGIALARDWQRLRQCWACVRHVCVWAGYDPDWNKNGLVCAWSLLAKVGLGMGSARHELFWAWALTATF